MGIVKSLAFGAGGALILVFLGWVQAGPSAPEFLTKKA